MWHEHPNSRTVLICRGGWLRVVGRKCCQSLRELHELGLNEFLALLLLLLFVIYFVAILQYFHECNATFFLCRIISFYFFYSNSIRIGWGQKGAWAGRALQKWSVLSQYFEICGGTAVSMTSAAIVFNFVSACLPQYLPSVDSCVYDVITLGSKRN